MLTEVDGRGARGNFDSLPYFFDLVVANQDDLIAEDRAGIGVDEFSGADSGDLSAGRAGEDAAHC